MSVLSNISCDAHNIGLGVYNLVKPKLTICTILDTSISAIDVRRNFVGIVPEAGRILYICNYVQWFRKTEQFVHIRKAGLWIKLFFNIKDKIIEVSIEPKMQLQKKKQLLI